MSKPLIVLEERDLDTVRLEWSHGVSTKVPYYGPEFCARCDRCYWWGTWRKSIKDALELDAKYHVKCFKRKREP